MPIPFKFDFKNPDYRMALEYRRERLHRIRQNPEILPVLKAFYRDNPAQFIIDWGTTYDPRNADRDLPSLVPFLLFEAQEEWVHWFVDLWRNGKSGITEKARDMGVTWLAVATSATICMFRTGISVGFGSRKSEYVDRLGDPKSILYKVREFIKNVPREFRGTWDERKHGKYMKIQLPDTQCFITGEAGDQIGRGDRKTFHFDDESAFYAHPELIEASISNTTRCRVQISTPFGMDNPFAQKRFSGKISVYTMNWQKHPAKDQEWYDRICDEINDPTIIAQEVDLNYSASKDNIVISAVIVESAIDAHLRLGIKPTGIKKGALDVADRGKDLNAFGGRHGILLKEIESWSGKQDDLYETAERSIELCDEYGYLDVDYDADGLGASVRGDSRVINEKREGKGKQKINFIEFHGSGAVVNPEDEMYYKNTDISNRGQKNEDAFENYKAQSWWALRYRFILTHRLVQGEKRGDKIEIVGNRIYHAKKNGDIWSCDIDDLIAISSKAKEVGKLKLELSQPTYDKKGGKILINKKPKGALSPNHADTAMILFAPAEHTKELQIRVL